MTTASKRSRTADQLRSDLRSLEWQMDDLRDQIDDLEEEIEEAEHECPNCGERSPISGKPCSRRCVLHLEWAAELKARQEG